MSDNMEDYTIEAILEQAKAEQQNRETDPKRLSDLLCKMVDMNVALSAERNRLKAQVEELKAMFVDALGDGFYDGYLKCKKDFEEQRDNEPWYISKVGDNDVIAMSEDYESNHRYSKSINDIKIKAICDFKDELTKSVSVMFKPHIEGVCAVVIEKLSAAKGGE